MPPAVEDGKTTTEFQGKIVLQVLTAVVSVATAFGLHLDAAQQAALIGAGAVAVPAVLEVAYIIGRSLRKRGLGG